MTAFTEFYLQPPASKKIFFATDTTDLLNRIQELNKQCPLPEGTLLVSWDVVSMFPNIDNELGLGEVKTALETRDQYYCYDPSVAYWKLLRFALKAITPFSVRNFIFRFTAVL